MKKHSITKEQAMVIAVDHAIFEINSKPLKPFIAAFAIKSEKDVSMMELNGIIPDAKSLEKIIKNGLKTGVPYVILIVTEPNIEVENNLFITAFDKDFNRDTHISPYEIINGKIVPIAKKEKGFSIFLEE